MALKSKFSTTSVVGELIPAAAESESETQVQMAAAVEMEQLKKEL